MLGISSEKWHPPRYNYLSRSRAVAPEWVDRHLILGLVFWFGCCAYAANVALNGFVAYYLYVHRALGVDDQGWYAGAIALGVSVMTLHIVFSEMAAPGYGYGRFRRGRISQPLASWIITVVYLVIMGFVLKISDQYSRVWAVSWFIGSSIGLLFIDRMLDRFVLFVETNGRISRTIIVLGADGDCGRVAAILSANGEETRFSSKESARFHKAQDIVVAASDIATVLDYGRFNRIDHIILASAYPPDFSKLIEDRDRLTEICANISLAIHLPVPVKSIKQVQDCLVMRLVDNPLRDWRGCAKWIEDKLSASLLLVFFAPAMLLIAAAIYLESGTPILFRQARFGLKGRHFQVLKFRTMTSDHWDSAGSGGSRRNDQRVTRVGKLLRRTSLDELPQLFNVLRGEMSLVGPRAHPIEMMVGDKYYFDAVERYSWRHRVKPGLTGRAQVNGNRGEIDSIKKAEDRITHDLAYIDGWSVWTDLKIMVQTLRIIMGKNVY